VEIKTSWAVLPFLAIALYPFIVFTDNLSINLEDLPLALEMAAGVIVLILMSSANFWSIGIRPSIFVLWFKTNLPNLDLFLWTDFEKCTVNDDIEKTIDYSKLVQILKDQSKKIYCFTIEKYSKAILEIIDQEFKFSKVKIILTKCNPPITGFDGKVSIVRILENN